MANIVYYEDIQFPDNVYGLWGTNEELRLWHNGTNSYLFNYTTGNLYIGNSVTDGATSFLGDDGSGGETAYLTIDGQYEVVRFVKNARFNDNVKANFGTNDDLQISHTGSLGMIDNQVGDLIVKVSTDDGDIIFQSDNGSGAIDTYIRIDGGQTRTEFSKATQHEDNVIANFGSSSDLQIYHNATDSYILNGTGDLEIINNQDDGDIVFSSDNGSGGNTPYLKLWGAIESLAVYKDMLFVNDGDGGKIKFGASQDLQIYHEGANSFIDEAGTGNLYIRSATNMFFHTYGSGKRWITLTENAGVEMFYDDSLKFNTTATGIQVTDDISIGTSIIHTGDTDTKISFGTDEIVLTTAGADAVTVKSDGKVGIGLTTLYNKLGVAGNINIQGGNGSYLTFNNGDANIVINNNGTGRDLSFKTYDGTSNAERMRIDKDGNVGIGTSSPSELLELKPGAGGDSKINMVNSSGTQKALIGYDNGNGGLINLYNDAGTRNVVVRGYGDSYFKGGNFGIGTDTPTAALQVVGLVEYADNAAALLAGLTAGAFYRTGDLLKVVH